MLRGIHKYLDKSNWDEARKAVKEEDVSVPGGFGQWTPLHIACKRNPPIDIIDSLIASGGDSLDKFDACNRLPIHYAADYGASAKVFKALVEGCPKSILGVDDDGLTPLHLTLKQISSTKEYPYVDVIKALSSDPSVVWIADSNDKIPLHYAVSDIDNLSDAQLRALVKADYNTVLSQAGNGMTPLHLALKSCTKEISLDKVRALLGLSTDGRKMINEEYEVTRVMCHEDMLPLHYACQKQMYLSVESFRLILERCPEAASTSAKNMGYPLDILEATIDSEMLRSDTINKKSDIVFAYNTSILYRREPDRLRRIGDNILADMSKKCCLSDINKSLWIWMCSLPEEEDREGTVIEIVSSILTTFKDMERPRFLSTIKTVTDDDKVMPLFELASAKTKETMSPYLRVVNRFMLKKEKMEKNKNHLVFNAIDDFAKDNKNVVVKFFSNKQEFEREVTFYENIQSNAPYFGVTVPIVPMVEKYDLRKNRNFFKDVEELVNYENTFNLTSYPCAMILAAGGDALKPFGNESNDKISQIFKDIAESFLCLHRSGYVLKEMKLDLFCNLAEKVMLRCSDCLTHISTLKKPHFYGSVDDLNVSTLPPEMISKLDAKGILRYEEYWGQVFDDFLIANEFSEEELKESTKLQAILKEQNCSAEAFWDRVQKHWNLWMKIRPRQVGDEHFVVKCFRYDSKGMVHNPDELPYELVPWDENIEVWFFATLFFEEVTGETLFHSNKNNVFINDDDFKSLYYWNMENPRNANRMNSLTDPFARDFLRVTLTSTRLSTMENVLQHDLFDNDKDEEQRNSIKKGCFVYEKLLQQNVLIQENLKKRTNALNVISMETQIKFEHSIWKQLAGKYELDEVKYPASFIFLPYALEHRDGIVTACVDKVHELPRGISLAILDVLHYVHLLQSAKKQGLDHMNTPSIEEYLDMNLHLVESQEKKPLNICEQILAIAKNVESLMTKHFESYLPTVDARSVAHKLVIDSLQGIIDYDKCINITGAAEEALKAVSSLIEVVGKSDETMAESLLNRHFLEMCRGHCFDLSLDSKEQAYQTLFKMFKKFAEDPVLAIQSLLDSAFVRLLKSYSGLRECYVYVVDEYTGLPLIVDNNQSVVQLTSDAMKAFIPTTLLVAKAHYSQGIQQFFGNSTDSITAEQNKCSVGNFSQFDVESELFIIQSALNKHLRSRREFDSGQDVLNYLEDFHNNVDSQSNLFGLQRLSSPNNLLIWTKPSSYALAVEEGQKALAYSELANQRLHKKNQTVDQLNDLDIINDSPSIPMKYQTNSLEIKKSFSNNSESSHKSAKTSMRLSKMLKEKDKPRNTASLLAIPIENSISLQVSDEIDSKSSCDTNTVITEAFSESPSESESSAPQLNSKSVETDESSRFYYSSTESEQSAESFSLKAKKTHRPTPEKEQHSSKLRSFKPYPGDKADTPSRQRNEGIYANKGNNSASEESPNVKKTVDVNRFKLSRSLYMKKRQKGH